MLATMMTKYSLPHSGGFTIIELMVTLVVLGILLAIGLPQFSELTAAQRQRAAASALFDSLLLARSEAVTRNTTASIATANLSGGWNVTVNVPADTSLVLRTQRSLAGVNFAPSAPAIKYNAQGRLAEGANSIQVTSPNSPVCRIVSIGSSGRPRVSTYNDGCP